MPPVARVLPIVFAYFAAWSDPGPRDRVAAASRGRRRKPSILPEVRDSKPDCPPLISKLAYYPGRSPYVLAGILRHERPARPAPPEYNLRARLRRRTVPLSGTARRYGSRPEGTRQCSGRLGRHEIPSPSGDARME
ncbi:uncharacterized protein LAJ45_01217 [Morchella importuna]|uniref:uncharacterized protein n=1 Tax=Morchella importuna TaxID=1174673 RepID=UPI001E8D4E4A|nr:uncharacterized protein LAJ45_01217 [Morchella importuna]KAH8154686.1 hypothetical protein LAJ45_01217 [Morchella importuna]